MRAMWILVMLGGCGQHQTLPGVVCDAQTAPVAFDEVTELGFSAEALAAEVGPTLVAAIAWDEDVVGWGLEQDVAIALEPNRDSAELVTYEGEGETCGGPQVMLDLTATMGEGPLEGAVAGEAVLRASALADAEIWLHFLDLDLDAEALDRVAAQVGEGEVERVRLWFGGDEDGSASLEADVARADSTVVVQHGSWSVR